MKWTEVKFELYRNRYYFLINFLVQDLCYLFYYFNSVEVKKPLSISQILFIFLFPAIFNILFVLFYEVIMIKVLKLEFKIELASKYFSLLNLPYVLLTLYFLITNSKGILDATLLLSIFVSLGLALYYYRKNVSIKKIILLTPFSYIYYSLGVSTFFIPPIVLAFLVNNFNKFF